MRSTPARPGASRETAMSLGSLLEAVNSGSDGTAGLLVCAPTAPFDGDFSPKILQIILGHGAT